MNNFELASRQNPHRTTRISRKESTAGTAVEQDIYVLEFGFSRMSFSFESIGGFSQAVSQVIIHNSENEFDHRNYTNASGDGDSTNSPENHLGPEEANDHHHDDSGPSKHNWRYNMEQNMDASLAGSNATSTAASTKARIARLKKNNNNILALEERLEMQKERYGEIHLDVAATLSVLAGQLRKRGDYAQAIDHLMKALSIRSNIFGEGE